jgi:hypothetical protein
MHGTHTFKVRQVSSLCILSLLIDSLVLSPLPSRMLATRVYVILLFLWWSRPTKVAAAASDLWPLFRRLPRRLDRRRKILQS